MDQAEREVITVMANIKEYELNMSIQGFQAAMAQSQDPNEKTFLEGMLQQQQKMLKDLTRVMDRAGMR